MPRYHAGGCSLIIVSCFTSVSFLLDSSTLRLFFPLLRVLPFEIALPYPDVQVRQLPRPHLPSHAQYQVHSGLFILTRFCLFRLFHSPCGLLWPPRVRGLRSPATLERFGLLFRVSLVSVRRWFLPVSVLLIFVRAAPIVLPVPSYET